MYSTSIIFLLCAAHGNARYGPLNFQATFDPSPAPFTIDVDPKFIEQTKQKVALSRFPITLQDVAPFEEGPTVYNATTIRDYWLGEYDWFDIQTGLNEKYKHFTTVVRPDVNSNYSHDVELHFVHHRSNRSDAIPLLFMHGWPGSFLEVGHIIDSLTSPPNISLPAFHVVTPSIPGIGFSPPPEFDGFGPVAAGHAFHALMLQLGYSKYVIQAGDWGGITLKAIAAAYPESVVSALSNFWPIKPSASDRAALANGTASDDEKRYLQVYDNYVYNRSGYRYIQMMKPLQLAFSLSDSPIGNAMWIYNLMATAVTKPHFWEPKDIITWSMMYYIQGPYAGGRYYKNAWREGLFSPDILDWESPPTTKEIMPPIAITEFSADAWFGLPLNWAQRDGNVVIRYMHNEGGHFAATEVPQLLLDDIWGFFGNKTLSNTQVFY